MNKHLHDDPTPLAKLLAPMSRKLTPDFAEELVKLRADPETQARLDELANKNTEGLLSEEELAEYETYVHAINFISILQSQARRLLRNNRTTV